MIDELKAIEETYSNRIKEFKVESFDLEKEKKILNETFRDKNKNFNVNHRYDCNFLVLSSF